MIPWLKIVYAVAVLAIGFFAGTWAEGLHRKAEVASLVATQAKQDAIREGQARRAIETARQAEREGLQDEIRNQDALKGRLADTTHDLSVAHERLRQLESAARAYRVPAACAAPSGGPDPIGILTESAGEAYEDAAKADALAARLETCIAGRRNDRKIAGGS